jgi:putative transposase
MLTAMSSRMLYLIIAQLFSLLLSRFIGPQRSDRPKDLEILILRQQLRIMPRQHPQTRKVARWDKLILAILAHPLATLSATTHQRLNAVALLFQPETLLRGHRDLVQRKWTCAKAHKGGRPATNPELQTLLLHLAQENPSWGYGKLQGELLKRGHPLGVSTIRDILKRQHVPPAPERDKQGGNWSAFLGHYKEQLIACDFFTVETAWLKTLYAFFFIELSSRRVHFAGCTAHPTAEWVTQQARQLTWTLQDEQRAIKFLIRDRDAKFPQSFDTVFAAENITVVKTPFRTPVANAYAERWIKSARTEALDRLLILNEAHRRRVLIEYTEYDNQRRPHQGIEQRCPIALPDRHGTGAVQRHDVLGGIIHDYERAA